MNILKTIKNPDSNSDMQKKIRLLQITGAVLVCVLMASVFLYCYFRYGKEIYELFGSPEKLRDFLAVFKGSDRWVFVAIRAFQTVVKIIPAEPLEIGSGALYGIWGGMLLCVLGTMLGSIVIIALTRAFGRRLVNVFIPVEKLDSLKFLQDEKKVYFSLFIIYLIPGTPKDILTYAASLTKLDMRKFLFVTGIARIPSILSSTWCGQELIDKNYTLAIIILAATLVLTAVCSLIYKKLTDSHGKKADTDKESG